MFPMHNNIVLISMLFAHYPAVNAAINPPNNVYVQNIS